MSKKRNLSSLSKRIVEGSKNIELVYAARDVRSTDGGRQSGHKSLTPAISEPRNFNGISTQIK